MWMIKLLLVTGSLIALFGCGVIALVRFIAIVQDALLRMMARD